MVFLFLLGSRSGIRNFSQDQSFFLANLVYFTALLIQNYENKSIESGT